MDKDLDDIQAFKLYIFAQMPCTAFNSPFFLELHLSGTTAASIPALHMSMTMKTLGNALSVQSCTGFLVPTIEGLDKCSVISHLFLVCRHSSQNLHHVKK